MSKKKSIKEQELKADIARYLEGYCEIPESKDEVEQAEVFLSMFASELPWDD